jgi:hypothetical protein
MLRVVLRRTWLWVALAWGGVLWLLGWLPGRVVAWLVWSAAAVAVGWREGYRKPERR